VLTQQYRQECLSRAYIQAVAGRAGLNCLFPQLDFGIDVTLNLLIVERARAWLLGESALYAGPGRLWSIPPTCDPAEITASDGRLRRMAEVHIRSTATPVHVGGRSTVGERLSCRVPSRLATASRHPPALPAGGRVRSVQSNQTSLPHPCSMIPERQLA
jgi:hypothetical protein